jgi:hypothetical protein
MAVLPALPPAAVPLVVVSAVDVVSVPPDARCPERAAVAGALAERVPDDLAGWQAWYEVRAPEPAAPTRVRFELHDDHGRVRVRRELSVGLDGCAAAAEALAIIVERYFEGVAWTAAVPLPELERAPEPEPELASGDRRWEVQAGVAGWRQVDMVPALALDVRVALARGWWAEGGLMVPYAPASEPIGVSVLYLDSLALRASARWRARRRAFALEVGPALTLAGERVTANPGLRNGPVYRLAMAAGVVASARWWFSASWALGIEADAEVSVSAPAFRVTGVGEVLSPARVPLVGLVGVSRAFGR